MADDAAHATPRLCGDATAQAHLSGLNGGGGTPRAAHQALAQRGAWCSRARVCCSGRDVALTRQRAHGLVARAEPLARVVSAADTPLNRHVLRVRTRASRATQASSC
jgi:hypothetical protein